MNNKTAWIHCALLLLATSVSAFAAPLPTPPLGPIQTVEARSVDENYVPIWLGPAYDEVIEEVHPSWDPSYIPMPLPISVEPNDSSKAPAGHVLVHNPVTGETHTLRVISGPSNYEGGNGGSMFEGLYGEEPNVLERTFSNMVLVGGGTFPSSTACRVVVQFTDVDGIAWGFTGSAHMVDAETLVTAGHVVYIHSFTDSGGTSHTVNSFFDWMDLYPGSSQGVDNWGRISATNVLAWTGWTQDEDSNWDVALLRVNRAVGMLSGWTGWRWGDSCNTVIGRTYNNYSFPAANCGQNDGNGNPLHNGLDMYFSGGHFELCSGNEIRFTTTPGCFTRVWGGMSGSGYYYVDGAGDRRVHAVVSNGDPNGTYADGVKFWSGVSDQLGGSFIPASRGSVLDLQSLYMRDNGGASEPLLLTAGDTISNLRFSSVNPTNGSGSGTWWYDVLLSTNDFITPSDTLLDTQSFSWSFPAMSQVNVGIGNFSLPIGLSSGTYYVGTRFEDGTDIANGNNDSSYWDALEIEVSSIPDPAADSAIPLDTTVYGGDYTDVFFEYSNNGALLTSVDLEIRASTNQIISGGDPLITVIESESLSGHGSWGTGFAVQIPVSLPDGTYYLGLRIVNSSWGDGDTTNNTVASDFTFTKLTSPDNNNCDNAIDIGSGTHSFDTTNATTDGATHPECQFDGTTNNDIWYRYVAPVSGIMTATTCEQLGGSADYDTDLVLYSGSSCGSLTLLDCNDDDNINACGSDPDYHSTVTATVTIGDTIYIRLGAFSPIGSGSGNLNVFTLLANDDCENAIGIDLGDTAFSTLEATTDGPQEFKCFGGVTANDIWFTYVSPSDGTLTVSTCNQADFDTEIVVYTGSCSNRTLVGCNDDTTGCAGNTSFLEVSVSQGVTYLIRVGGWSFSQMGDGIVTLDLDTGLLGDIDGDGDVDVTDLLLVIAAWGSSGGDGTDLDGDGIVAVGDILILIANWS